MENNFLIFEDCIERSIDEGSRLVEGYAVIFDSPSVRDLGFIETIHKGAITDETIKTSDVFCRLNHSNDKILARSKYGEGSLKLSVDDKGLKYSFEAPHTQVGDELLEYLRRGEITQSSFAFPDPKSPNSEKWSLRDGVLHKDIYKIDKLYDVAPVFTPAYQATVCSKRSIDKVNFSKELNEKLDNELQLIDDIFDI